MSKVLKVVGVAATILGVVASGGLGLAAAAAVKAAIGIGVATLSAISVGASIGASLLAPRPKAPKNSAESLNRLRATIDPRTPRKASIGITALANDIRDEEFSADQEYLHRFIVVAAHKINSIDEIWFDDKLAWKQIGGVQGEFVGYLDVQPILEGSAANAINISARMGSTRRYTGCAYVHIRYKLTGNTKKTNSPFASGVTTRITLRGKGAYFYDPRLDGTVPGGFGPARTNDQTTWYWDVDACRNPALALLHYLLGWRINGILSVGKGIPAERIDLESFIVAANICDELVAKPGGGTEPRYRCDGVWSEGDSPDSVLDAFKATMNADLDDVDGKIRVTIFRDDTAVVDASFTDADVLGEFSWEPLPPLDQSFNIVRGVHTDASDTALYQQTEYPDVTAASPDGIDRIDTFDLPWVESVGQAQRLAGLRLARQQHGGTFVADFQATAWAVQKNSIIRLTFAPRGFVNKLFRVAEMDIRQDGVVPLVLREEDPALYVAPTLSAGLAPVDTTPYDPFLAPISQALNDPRTAIRAASILNPRDASNVPRAMLIASDAGATASISIARHDWDYPDGNADVTREPGTITGLAYATDVYVYFDDDTLTNTTPTYFATTSANTGDNSTANPARHPIGRITTPAAAAPSVQASQVVNYGYGAVQEIIAQASEAAGAGTIDIQLRSAKTLVVLPAEINGTITSYATATGTLSVHDADGNDISAAFTLSTGANPQALTVSAYSGMTWAVTGGFDNVELTASLTILATGSGAWAGRVASVTITLDKDKPAIGNYVAGENGTNVLVPDAPAFTTAPIVAATFDNGNVSLRADFTAPYNADPAHKNSINYLEIIVHASTSATSYAFDGSEPQNERKSSLIAGHAAGTFDDYLFAYDAPANLYYQFSVRSARPVQPGLVAGGTVYSARAVSSRMRPSAAHNYTGNVGGTSATTIASVATNFNADNDRNSTTPPAATGVTISHTGPNTDGSVDVTVTFAYTNSLVQTAANNVDGYFIGLYPGSGNITYVPATHDPLIEWKQLPYDKRQVTFTARTPDKFYTAVVIAQRTVNGDVNSTGNIRSAAAQNTTAYQPSTVVTYSGYVGGQTATDVASATTRGLLALNADGTVANNKVLTGSIDPNAINLASYISEGSSTALVEQVGGDIYEVFKAASQVTLLAGNTQLVGTLILPFELTKNNPVNNVRYTMDVQILLLDVTTSTILTSAQVTIIEEAWQSANGSGANSLTRATLTLIETFSGLIVGRNYQIGMRATTTATNGAWMRGPRLFKLDYPLASQ